MKHVDMQHLLMEDVFDVKDNQPKFTSSFVLRKLYISLITLSHYKICTLANAQKSSSFINARTFSGHILSMAI